MGIDRVRILVLSVALWFLPAMLSGQSSAVVPDADALIAASRAYMGRLGDVALTFRLQAGVRTATESINSLKSSTIAYYRDRERDLAFIQADGARRSTLFSGGLFLDYDSDTRRWSGGDTMPAEIAYFRELAVSNLYAILIADPPSLELDWARIAESWRFRWVAAVILRDCLEAKFDWLDGARAAAAPIAEKLDGSDVWRIELAASGAGRTIWIQRGDKPRLLKAAWRNSAIKRTVTVLLGDSWSTTGGYELPNRLILRYDDDTGRNDVKADFILSGFRFDPLPDDFFTKAAVEAKLR